jgi:hypothetical protein
MRFRVILACLWATLCANVSFGQTIPGVEAYGGYSILRPNLPSDIGGSDASVERFGQFILNNVLGWNAGATVNITNVFGVTADLSGYYRSLGTIDIDGSDVSADLSVHSFLFGPQFSWSGERVRPFARALFGFGMLDASAEVDGEASDFDESTFAAAVGGGLDVVVHPRVFIRPIQFDYFPVRHSNGESLTFNNFRWGTGVVIRF